MTTTLKTTLTDPVTGKTVKWQYQKGLHLTKQYSEHCLDWGAHYDKCPKDHNSLIKVFTFEETLKYACICACHWDENFNPNN